MKGKSISEEVRKAAVDYKRSLDNLIKTIDNRPQIRKVTPAYQWGQSPSEVFLEVRLTQRFELPSCLKLYKESIELTEDHLHFLGYCSSVYRMKFELNIDLHEKIDPDHSTHTITDGQITFTLAKAQVAHWPLLSKGKIPPNAREWAEKQYKEELTSE
jgi:hypothetical protein